MFSSWDHSSNLPLHCLIALDGQFLRDSQASTKIKSSFVTTQNQESILWHTERSASPLAFQNLYCFSDYKLIDLFSSVKNRSKSMVFSKDAIMRNVLVSLEVHILSQSEKDFKSKSLHHFKYTVNFLNNFIQIQP